MLRCTANASIFCSHLHQMYTEPSSSTAWNRNFSPSPDFIPHFALEGSAQCLALQLLRFSLNIACFLSTSSCLPRVCLSSSGTVPGLIFCAQPESIRKG